MSFGALLLALPILAPSPGLFEINGTPAMAMIDCDKLKPLSDEVLLARAAWIEAAEALDSLLITTQAKDGAGDYNDAVKLAAERSKSARANYNDLARQLANQVHTLILHAELKG